MRKFGFSLIELLVVVAIIGILAGVAYPNYRNYIIRTNVASMYTFGSGLQAHVASNFFDNNNSFNGITFSGQTTSPVAVAQG